MPQQVYCQALSDLLSKSTQDLTTSYHLSQVAIISHLDYFSSLNGLFPASTFASLLST